MHQCTKFDLCCAARILYRAGLSVHNAGHLSVKVAPNQMLINRFGPSFATLLPGDILTCDYLGNVLQGEGVVNATVQLHGVIHRYNAHVTAVVHTHPPAVVTYSAFRKIPEVYDQESCMLAEDVSIVEEDYPGLAASEDRVRPVAEALGKSRAAILPNHGAITTGPDIRQATLAMLVLEGMAARNLAVAAAARDTGWAPRPISAEAALRAKNEIAHIPFLPPYWQDLQARLRSTDADLFEHQPEEVAA